MKMQTLATPSKLEYENLEVHVDKCSMRYEGLQKQFEQVDERLDKVEQKLDTLGDAVKEAKSTNVKALIAATVTIVTTIISAIAMIYTKMP